MDNPRSSLFLLSQHVKQYSWVGCDISQVTKPRTASYSPSVVCVEKSGSTCVFWQKTLKERDSLKELSVECITVLQWTFKK